MNSERGNHHRLLKVGFLVAGVASVGALAVMIATGIEKVKSGHGLDTYRTFWLVEFNWVAFLVLATVAAVAILGGLWFRYLEWREVKQLQARYPQDKP
jgi:hypothetical protein